MVSKSDLKLRHWVLIFGRSKLVFLDLYVSATAPTSGFWSREDDVFEISKMLFCEGAIFLSPIDRESKPSHLWKISELFDHFSKMSLSP